jgi:predicted transcriptional regulator
MPKTPTGRKAGRPKTYQAESDKPVTLSIRLPRALYERLQHTAVAQQTNITHVTAQTLEAFLGPQAPLRLDDITEALLAMGEAASALEVRCNTCPTCKPHVTATLDAAWPKLTATLEALPTTKEA